MGSRERFEDFGHEMLHPSSRNYIRPNGSDLTMYLSELGNCSSAIIAGPKILGMSPSSQSTGHSPSYAFLQARINAVCTNLKSHLAQ